MGKPGCAAVPTGEEQCAWTHPDGAHAGPYLFEVVLKYLNKLGISGENMGPHVMRATAAINVLDNGADIAKVQEWLGHANIATTRIYDHRKTRPEDSPTFKVSY